MVDTLPHPVCLLYYEDVQLNTECVMGADKITPNEEIGNQTTDNCDTGTWKTILIVFTAKLHARLLHTDKIGTSDI